MANQVLLSVDYIPNPTKGKALSLADIYVGIVDLDPKNVANQKQISVLQENGTTVQVAQPISTSAGGVPLYNGSPVTIIVDGSYSLRIDDSTGAQAYYVPQNVDSLADALEKLAPVDRMTLLRTLPYTPDDGQVVNLLGYYGKSENRDWQFKWNANSVEDDDQGMIIKMDAVTIGRWYRLTDNGVLRASYFGVSPTQIADVNTTAILALSGKIVDGSVIDLSAGGPYELAANFAGSEGGLIDIKLKNNITIYGDREEIHLAMDASQDGRVFFVNGIGSTNVHISNLNVNFTVSGSPSALAEARASIFWFWYDETTFQMPEYIVIENNKLRLFHPDGANMGADSLDGKLIMTMFYGKWDAPNMGYAKDLKFMNNHVRDTRARVIWLWHTSGVISTGNTYINSGEYPVYRCLTGNINLNISDNTFEQGTYFSGYPVFISGQAKDSYGITITGNTFLCGYNGAIGVWRARDVTISDNNIRLIDGYVGTELTAIEIANPGGGDISKIVIDSNVIDGMTQGIFLNNNLGVVDDVTISNNMITDSGGQAFSTSLTLPYPTGINFVGNTILNSGTNGMRAYFSGVISDNYIANSQNDGIDLSSGAGEIDLVIDGNTIKNCNLSAGTGYGINTVVSGLQITNNHISGANHTDDILSFPVDDPTTVPQNLIANNILSVAGIAPTSWTVSINNIVDNVLVP